MSDSTNETTTQEQQSGSEDSAERDQTWKESLEASRTPAEAGAAVIRDLNTPTILTCLIGLKAQGVDVSAGKTYVDQTIKKTAKTDDPIERMLIEHMTVLHVAGLHLHHKAGSATDPEVVKVFASAANKTSGEFRRQTTALKAYQAPQSNRSFTAIRQQNLANNQRVCFNDGGEGEQVEDAAPVEGSEQLHGDDHAGGRFGQRIQQEPTACGSRSSEPEEAGTING